MGSSAWPVARDREEKPRLDVIFAPVRQPRTGDTGESVAASAKGRRSPLCVRNQLRRLQALTMINHTAQSLVDDFGPTIERWVAREPDNPDALEALAWLMRLRLKVRRADPRTYADRKLPESLMRLLRG
jgi:hypothetical protein